MALWGQLSEARGRGRATWLQGSESLLRRGRGSLGAATLLRLGVGTAPGPASQHSHTDRLYVLNWPSPGPFLKLGL